MEKGELEKKIEEFKAKNEEYDKATASYKMALKNFRRKIIITALSFSLFTLVTGAAGTTVVGLEYFFKPTEIRTTKDLNGDGREDAIAKLEIKVSNKTFLTNYAPLLQDEKGNYVSLRNFYKAERKNRRQNIKDIKAKSRSYFQ